MNWHALKPDDQAFARRDNPRIAVNNVTRFDWTYVKVLGNWLWRAKRIKVAPQPKSRRPVKARKVWQCIGGITIEPYIATREEGDRAKPIYTLPRTKEAYDQLVEQMARACFDRWAEEQWGTHLLDALKAAHWEWSRSYHESNARAALSSIGINQPHA